MASPNDETVSAERAVPPPHARRALVRPGRCAGLASTLTAGIVKHLRADLDTAFPSVDWAPETLTEHSLVVPPAGAPELVDAVRQELLDHDWAICVCVTTSPCLWTGGRSSRT